MKIKNLFRVCGCIAIFFIVTSVDVAAQTYPPWEVGVGEPTEVMIKQYFVDNMYQGTAIWNLYKHSIDNFSPGKPTKYFVSPASLKSIKKGDCKALSMWLFENLSKKAPHSDPVLVLGKVIKDNGRIRFHHAWVTVRGRTAGQRIIIDLFHDDYAGSLVVPGTGIYSQYNPRFEIMEPEDVMLILHTADILGEYYGIPAKDVKINN